jgi:hypothetical protein
LNSGMPQNFIGFDREQAFLRLSCPSGGELGVALPRKRLLSLGFVVV